MYGNGNSHWFCGRRRSCSIASTVLVFIAFVASAEAASLRSLSLPFGLPHDHVSAWALSHGLKSDPVRLRSNRKLIFDGCPVTLEGCHRTTFSFGRKGLRNVSFAFTQTLTQDAPVAVYQRLQQAITAHLGPPWYDRLRTYAAHPTVAALRNSGQALVSSWHSDGFSAELRLDVGSTEGNLLRLILRATSNAGRPMTSSAARKVIRKADRHDASRFIKALEYAVKSLRRSKALKAMSTQGHAPTARLHIDHATLAGSIGLPRPITETHIKRAFRTSGLLAFSRTTSPHALVLAVRTITKGGLPMLSFSLTSAKSGILWHTAIELR